MDIAALLLTEGMMFIYHLVAYILLCLNMTFRRSKNVFKKVPDIATVVVNFESCYPIRLYMLSQTDGSALHGHLGVSYHSTR